MECQTYCTQDKSDHKTLFVTIYYRVNCLVSLISVTVDFNGRKYN